MFEVIMYFAGFMLIWNGIESIKEEDNVSSNAEEVEKQAKAKNRQTPYEILTGCFCAGAVIYFAWTTGVFVFSSLNNFFGPTPEGGMSMIDAFTSLTVTALVGYILLSYIASESLRLMEDIRKSFAHSEC